MLGTGKKLERLYLSHVGNCEHYLFDRSFRYIFKSNSVSESTPSVHHVLREWPGDWSPHDFFDLVSLHDTFHGRRFSRVHSLGGWLQGDPGRGHDHQAGSR